VPAARQLLADPSARAEWFQPFRDLVDALWEDFELKGRTGAQDALDAALKGMFEEAAMPAELPAGGADERAGGAAAFHEEVLSMLRGLTLRVATLERGPSPSSAQMPARGTGVLADLAGPPGALSPSDAALLESARAGRPRLAAAPREQAHPAYAPAPLPLGAETVAPPGLGALRDPDTESGPAYAEAPAPAPGSYGPAKLFRLQGAQGRVAQDYLNQDFELYPKRVVDEFDAACRRLAPQTGPLTVGARLQVWRDHVPAREHHLAARMGEALLDAYGHLEAGRLHAGMGRIALTLAALEQSVLDAGKWPKRAETLIGLPPAPLHLYRAPARPETPSKADGDRLGALAQLCSPTRATTALAVFKENNPGA